MLCIDIITIVYFSILWLIPTDFQRENTMSQEKRSCPELFFRAKKPKPMLSEQDEAAKQLYLDTRSEHAQLGIHKQFSVAEANDVLNRLADSYKLSSTNQWFHFAARKLYLDIIRKFDAKQHLCVDHQFATQDLLDAYNALQSSTLFASRGNAEQKHITEIIAHLEQKLRAANNRFVLTP